MEFIILKIVGVHLFIKDQHVTKYSPISLSLSLSLYNMALNKDPNTNITLNLLQNNTLQIFLLNFELINLYILLLILKLTCIFRYIVISEVIKFKSCHMTVN